ncbi:MAG: hypothetical protein Kow0037_19290 [Calditrichia bacterium]
MRLAYQQLNLPLNQSLSAEQIHLVLETLSQNHEDWQIRQAENALRHYMYFLSTKPETANESTALTHDGEWDQAIRRMQNTLRLKHRSYQTEKAYLFWVNDFRKFLGNKNPQQLIDADIQKFLSFLAVEKRVAASTQNQALNALIFFFRFLLKKQPANDITAVRSHRKKRLPVVLTPAEIQRVFK